MSSVTRLERTNPMIEIKPPKTPPKPIRESVRGLIVLGPVVGAPIALRFFCLPKLFTVNTMSKLLHFFSRTKVPHSLDWPRRFHVSF